MAKMWAGVTAGVTSSIADDFNSSIRFDCKMYKEDITGSMAHAAMLGGKGIISQEDADQLIDGLQGILDDLNSGKLEAWSFPCRLLAQANRRNDVRFCAVHRRFRTQAAQAHC